MGGWGQPHDAGAGSTASIEEAHKELDNLKIPPGPLANRTLALVDRVHDLARQAEALLMEEQT